MTKTHDKHTETHACVLISRQAVITALVFSDDTGGMTCGQIAKVLDVIKALPPAQPTDRETHAFSDGFAAGYKCGYERGKEHGTPRGV